MKQAGNPLGRKSKSRIESNLIIYLEGDAIVE